MGMPTPTPLFLVRTARGLSQGELARLLSTDRATISRIESGESQPRRELVIRLTEFFNHKITRDQIVFPEFYRLKGKKPSRRASAESVALHG